MFREAAVVVAASLVLTTQACSDEGGAEPEGPRRLPTSAVSSTPPTVSPTAGPASLDGKVEEARQALSREQGHDLDEITVVSAEPVTWPSSAYGCPSHEATYTPGSFPGYRIVLEANDQSYVYMGSQDSRPKRCLFLD